MANREVLKKYLVDEEKGYLLDENNNGKTIMLSGKWGCGKTHFWKNDIEDILQDKQKEDKKSYVYVSLYGKTSIESVETDLFMQAYNSVIGDADMISKLCSTSLTATKKFGTILLSNVEKVAEKAEDLVKEDKFKKAGDYLSDGGIICFDDFERKSKDIDLNDLFGFITQLTIEFNCKVIIILNDDVFEGNEKRVFANVKEKTVSKFLYYKPTIEELFDSIYSFNEKYKILDEYRDIILETIVETEELNARIYVQVLNNLLEWRIKNQVIDRDLIRCIVLVSINFILHHTTFSLSKIETTEYNLKTGRVEGTGTFYNNINVVGEDDIDEYVLKHIKKNIPIIWKKERNIIEYLISRVKSSSEMEKNKMIESVEESILTNKELFKSLYFLEIGFSEDIEEDIFSRINNFIETGILIDA